MGCCRRRAVGPQGAGKDCIFWKEFLIHEICYMTQTRFSRYIASLSIIFILFWYLGNMLDTKDSPYRLQTLQKRLYIEFGFEIL